jgi:hypothetical protein
MIDYYKLPSVSNSSLTQLKQLTNSKDWFDPSDAYMLGTLLDAMITEPNRVDFAKRTLDHILIDYEMWYCAYKMMFAFSKESWAPRLLQGCEMQKISNKLMQFSVNGMSFEMNCKCKWDFFGKNIAGDIKTTMARTQKEFEAVCNYFEYYRGRAWYMDLEQTDNDILICISKVNFKVFYIRIKRGDENYLKGKEQYEELALKYFMLMYK